MKSENNKKTICALGIYGAIFLLMLVCNVWTPYVVDDFRYMYSFYDGTRIDSLWDIVMSMRVHRYHMNGRIVAHTLVQLFGMLPAWFFDIANSGVFVLTLALVHKYSRGQLSRNNVVLVALFTGAWIFCPVFGQVNLWQDGAFNYLWSGMIALLFLQPFVEDYLQEKQIRTFLGKVVFLAFSFFMGAYSETMSAAAIFMAMGLTGLMVFWQKRKMRPIWCMALVFAILGYLFIYTAPAQWREKSAEMKLSVLFQNFLTVASMYWMMLGVLLVIFVVAFLVNVKQKTETKRIWLALVFLAGSLAANFIMMFAQYYTQRSAIGAFLYLLGADGILLYPIVQKLNSKRAGALAAAVLLLIVMPMIVGGVTDIYQVNLKIETNEAYLHQCAQQGVLDVTVPVVVAETEYSAIWGLKYLDTETTDIWPNDYMSVYYGVNSILGVADTE
ncbi:MAG: hypothetical protein J6V25_01820 [Oscillospiraceae bacterium]|nr:hypothetical protein [Oscillospiraceae bacterium]